MCVVVVQLISAKQGEKGKPSQLFIWNERSNPEIDTPPTTVIKWHTHLCNQYFIINPLKLIASLSLSLPLQLLISTGNTHTSRRLPFSVNRAGKTACLGKFRTKEIDQWTEYLILLEEEKEKGQRYVGNRNNKYIL